MAKSLRSKWRRKCRAVKRIRYGQKELERLKKTLGIHNDDPTTQQNDTKDINMADIADLVNFKQPKDILQIEENSDEEDNQKKEEIMEVDGGKVKHKYNERTLRDQFGHYPVWLNQRKIRQLKKRSGKSKSKRKNKNSKKRLVK